MTAPCRAILAVLLLVVVSGCTGTVASHHFVLTPEEMKNVAAIGAAPVTVPLPGLKCHVVEVRPSWHSTIALGTCFDPQGRALGLVSAPGQPVITTGMQVVGAAASVAGPVVGAVLLGNKIVEAATILDGATINAVTTGSVTTTGTVGGTVNVGTIPNVSVNPVTGSFNLVGP